jgi:hypothetical protein
MLERHGIVEANLGTDLVMCSIRLPTEARERSIQSSHVSDPTEKVVNTKTIIQLLLCNDKIDLGLGVVGMSKRMILNHLFAAF